MKKARSSLWWVVGMVLGIAACAVTSMWLLSWWTLSHALDQNARRELLETLGEMATVYTRGGAAMEDLYHSAKREGYLMRLESPAGKLITDLRSQDLQSALWVPLPTPQSSPVWHERALPGTSDTLLITGYVLHDGNVLWVGRTDAADHALIGLMRNEFLLVTAFVAVLALVPVFWFGRRVIQPVQQLSESARSLAAADDLGMTSGEDLHLRLQVKDAIPELHEFVGSFNASLDRVQMLTEEVEAANDQLAHELRTPLARMRGYMEVALAHACDESGRDAAAACIEEIERGSALIQSILSVRAGDSRSMRLHLETMSIKELVTDICELFAAAAEQRGLELELLVKGDVTMLADRQRLHQAISNLLDNAFAYTPRGGLISVLLDIEPQYAVIHVRDSGPGLSDNDLPRIWRRFMRGSAASAKTPGIGLGLSLVAAVANVHRGEAGAENRPEGGAHFWIKLPWGLR